MFSIPCRHLSDIRRKSCSGYRCRCRKAGRVFRSALLPAAFPCRWNNYRHSLSPDSLVHRYSCKPSWSGFSRCLISGCIRWWGWWNGRSIPGCPGSQSVSVQVLPPCFHKITDAEGETLLSCIYAEEISGCCDEVVDLWRSLRVIVFLACYLNQAILNELVQSLGSIWHTYPQTTG